jgi:2-oxoglutarate dehydrogenase E2 component (dihydrolipoamide succinyltransferase)
MTSEIKVPTLPESVADALIVMWHKKEGDPVKRDEVLVDIETDKVVMEVPAAEDGILGKIIEPEGTTVSAHQLIGSIEEGGADSGVIAAADNAPVAADDSAEDSSPGQTSPSVRKLLGKHGLSPSDIKGSGKNGRISKEDVEKHVAGGGSAAPAKANATANATANVAPAPAAASAALPIVVDGERTEKRVPMSRMRARIAERLLSATQTTAMLTTFNEVDMSQFIALRSQYKDRFEKSHEVKLGFMSIFIKAATEALKRYPDVNASIDGDDVVYHGFCDIGVAVSSERGLVVPVLRNTEFMSLADVEKTIGHYAGKARDGKLTMDEMTGGTFTVSNGGVFGSLLSTPILNPPQSAILGMHATQDRPVAVNGEVVIRPMMYIALSYDHRIVDGKGAVGFLKTIKELVEDPARIVLDI